MLEGLKDALEHVEDLARENEKTEVVESAAIHMPTRR